MKDIGFYLLKGLERQGNGKIKVPFTQPLMLDGRPLFKNAATIPPSSEEVVLANAKRIAGITLPVQTRSEIHAEIQAEPEEDQAQLLTQEEMTAAYLNAIAGIDEQQ